MTITSAPVSISVTQPLSPPYPLPSRGTALSIGMNSSDSIAPGPYRTDLSNWNYTLFTSFGGGAFVKDYSAGGAFVLAHGGGHRAPVNTGAAIFDFTDATWKYQHNANGVPVRVADYSPSELVVVDGRPGVIGGSSPPMPAPGHTYFHLQPLPRSRGGGSKGSIVHLIQSNYNTNPNTNWWSWKMDLETGLWSPLSVTAANSVHTDPYNYDNWCFYDEPTNRWYMFPLTFDYQNGLSYLDGNDWRWKFQPLGQSAASGAFGQAYAGLYDPVRRLAGMVVSEGANSGWLRLIDLNNFASSSKAIQPSGAGFPSWPDNTWQFYPPDGCFYLYDNRVSWQTLYKLTPPTSGYLTSSWTVSTQQIGGERIPERVRRAEQVASYNTFFYVPAIQCFAYIPGGANKVLLIKPL